MSIIKGYQVADRAVSEVDGQGTETGLNENHVTVQKIGSNRNALDVLQKGVFIVGNDTVEAGSTDRTLVATSHVARVGDQIRFTVGTNIHQEVTVVKIPDANTIILGAALLAAPSAGVDTFSILRHITPTFDDAGNITASVAAADVTFQYNSVSTDVEEVTATPANSRPLPVKIMDSDGDIMAIDAGVASVTDATAVGFLTTIDEDTNSINDKLPLTIGQKANATSLAVTLSTEQDIKVDSMVADLGTIDDKLPTTIGQKADLGSLSVTLSTEQDAKVDLMVADLDTVAIDTTAINGKIPAIGSQASTASLSVTIASDEGDIPVSNAMQLPASLGQKAKGASLPVTLASDEDSIKTLQAGKSLPTSVVPFRHEHSVAITTADFTNVDLVTGADINRVEVFDSSGETLSFYVGPVASEVRQFHIFPGGNGAVDLFIPSGSRIDIKADSANTAAGELIINFFS